MDRFKNENRKLEETISDKSFLKNRKFTHAIPYLNDYLIKFHIEGYHNFKVDCGRYIETEISNSEIAIYFKSHSNNNKFNTKLIERNNNKEILVFKVNFNTCLIKLFVYKNNGYFLIG